MAKVAGRLVKLTGDDLLGCDTAGLFRIAREVRLVAASALTQAAEKKRSKP